MYTTGTNINPNCQKESFLNQTLGEEDEKDIIFNS